MDSNKKSGRQTEERDENNVRSFRLPKPLWDKLRQVAEANEVSYTDIVVSALVKYLKNA